MKINSLIAFFFSLFFLPLQAVPLEDGKKSTVDPFVVVLDAGHGGA
nr:hypothetical protein [Maribacter algicola]